MLTDPIAAAFAPVAMVIGLVPVAWRERVGFAPCQKSLSAADYYACGNGRRCTAAYCAVRRVTGSGADLFVAWMHSMGQNWWSRWRLR